ncbi:MAG: DUF1553 domain-containing protein [Planctomyces sp.]
MTPVFRSLTLIALNVVLPFAAQGEESSDYASRIRPILRDRCYACHGGLKQEGNLRLDTAASAIQGGDSGSAVRPGESGASLLLKRVASTKPEERMPPEQEGEPLTAEQIELIRRWIDSGAKAPADEEPEADPRKHWAFQTLVPPTIPETRSPWIRNPIDAFLDVRQRAAGLTPQPEAPRLILLRRLHFDLIGLPPTSEEIAACENDPSPLWYEQTAERLLNDPSHGERWARHWMDIWRYSDWWGLGDQLRNSQKHIWHWRDWIIESLNADTPYDEMIRLMLAADELHPNDLSRLRATGYLARNYWLFNRPQWMEETVEHVSKGFLGLTMNCSKCHDHKYDPIEQKDFYRMRAFFEPYHVRLDVIPGQTDLTQDGIPRAFDGLPEEPTWIYVRGDERNPDKSQQIAPGVPEILAFDQLRIEPVSLPAEAWQPERRTGVIDAYLTAAQKGTDAAEMTLQKAMEDEAAAAKTAGASALPKAQSARIVAESALSLAKAELLSVGQRAEAQRAEWDSPESDREAKRRAAVQAERQVAVVRARHAVAVAEHELTQVAADRKAAGEKKLTEARETLEKATVAATSDVGSSDQYTRFTGAAWTPTRFFNSTADDPEVKFPQNSTGRRKALAKWITDRRNPLTARVAVNHIWTRHMGQPLVPTVFDFGRKGIPPKHPELLDWLAMELIDSGWSMKHVHTLIVSSAAYRRSSSIADHSANGIADDAGLNADQKVHPGHSADSGNELWWRRLPIRMESQVIRDSLLSLSGRLDPAMGGPPVPADQQAASTRRSLYFFHSNNERNLFLTTFDEALVKDCYRREHSIVPQQALALSNSAQAMEAAEQISARITKTSPEEAVFIREAFRVLVGIDASEEEIAAGREAVDAWRRLPDGSDAVARTSFVWALINHNDFVTLR